MPKTQKSISTKAAKPANSVFSQDSIAQRAYELFIESGGQHGRDVEHWLMAERELIGKPSARRHTRAPRA